MGVAEVAEGARLVSLSLHGLAKLDDDGALAHIVFVCGSPVPDFALCSLAVLLQIASKKSTARRLTAAGSIVQLVRVLNGGLQKPSQSFGRQVSSIAMLRYAAKILLQLSQHAHVRTEFVQRGALSPLAAGRAEVSVVRPRR